MLSTKKLLYKIVDSFRVRTTTVTGTTNANGTLLLSGSGNAIKPADSVLWGKVIVTNDTNCICIPFKYGNTDGHWYAKVVDWRTLENKANTSVTITAGYIVGGGKT